VKKNLLILILFPLFVNAQINKLEQIKFVTDFINCFKNNDREKLITFISFPLDRSYPIPDINDSKQFLLRYNQLFDDTLIKKIIESDIKKDWDEVGWRGIMFNNGTLWLDPYSKKLIGLNYQTQKEKILEQNLIEKERNFIYPTLRKYNRPVLVLETSKFRIRIDEIKDYVYRYASWSIDRSMNEAPDLVISNGKRISDGTGGNHNFIFVNNGYTYDCSIIVLGRQNSPPAELSVYTNEKQILTEPAITLKY